MPSSRLRRGIVYVASFGLARGALFGAPLLLANLLPAVDYGRLETAQAAASLSAGIATLGTGSVVPLVLLGQDTRTRFGAIVAHHLLIATACALLALATWAFGVALAWPLAMLFTAAVTLQALGSTHLKTLGRGEASVLLDAGLFGLMALAAATAWLARSNAPARWVVAAVAVYVSILAWVYITVLRALQPDRTPAARLVLWRQALVAGIPLMLGGVVSLLATTSGRLGMGVLAGPLATADYAVLARAGALPIVAHQLILIASFRTVFTADDDAVARTISRIVLLVAASALAFCALAPWLGHFLGPAFDAAFARFRRPGFWIIAQSILWSAIALNDLVISRKQVMLRILPVTAGFMVFALAAAWAALKTLGLDLTHFVYTHSVLMLSFYVVQSVAMRAHGIRMRRVWLTAAGSYLALVALTTLLPQAALDTP